MKKAIVFLAFVGLLPSAFALGQDDGRHGRNKDKEDGGISNSGPSRGEDRGGNSGWKDDHQNPNGGSSEKKPIKEKQNRPKFQRQHNSNNLGSGGLNGGSNRQGNNSNNFNNQTQPLNNRHSNGRNNESFNQSRTKDKNSFNQERPHGWQNNNQSGNPNRIQSGSIPSKFQKMGIRSVPSPIRDHSRILTTDRSHSVIIPPKTGPSNQPVSAKNFSAQAMSNRIVQNHMTTITNNSTFMAQINVNSSNETRANNYYWHNWNGINYCHYYDPWGYHWYGWYIGSNCFWTRWYWGNWWWYDNTYDRWCYWHDGGWWWQDPYHVNVVYVYNDGNYSQLNSSSSYDDGNNGGQTFFQSNDGTRRVKIMSGGDAFLYDTSNSPSFDPIYLGSAVKDVKFSNTSNGGTLQIMLTLQDGSFELFDAYGNHYHGDGNGN